MNANTIKGLKLISEGINMILDSASERVTIPETDVVAEPKKAEKKVEKKDSYTREELSKMTYNDLKKLAKEMGISAVGNRKELVEKILLGDEEEVPELEEEVVVEDEAETEVESEEESDEDEESDDEEEETTDLEAMLEELSEDELRELLESVDIPSKGKKQALITKVLNAVEDGLLDLDFDDEESEEDEEEEESVEDTAEEETEEEEAEDDEDDDESEDVTANMTKKRRKKFDEICDDTADAFESGDLTRDELIEFINEFDGTKEKFKKTSDEDIIKMYLDRAAMLVDDDGVEVEEGAYYINEEPYCCGHPLVYDEKKNQYVCESCGSTYDAE